MKLISPGLKDWKRFWKGDLIAGISVAFIAVPLNLGIGLASGVPPLAGVIPCVIGGLLIVWFSGGHLNVHSTPKMLIGVTAAGVITLGNGDLLLGYKLFLSAVVIAGFIQLILGLLRMGFIGELIPATVVKSIISSVGIIIIFKQFNVFLGAETEVSSTMDHALNIGNYILNLNPVVALIGLVSLLIMFLHSKIDLPVVRVIPAAVWVILISVSYSLVIGLASDEGFGLFGFHFETGSKYLISLPADITQSITLPDFSQISSRAIWNLVPIIVLISSIEGILSAKAIDRLDPLKRRSNVNKELAATGFGTAVSGFVGGLPVIPAIVGTSVGVNHNGKSSLMNTMHGVMIVILIVALGGLLKYIPLAALAGILLHTGYRLVNPQEIFRIYKIGKEQLTIFLITLTVVLLTDLMVGIIIGTILALVFHVFHLKSLIKLLTILFKPNVVSYEEDEENKYYVGVRGYCNFLNYPRLRSALDLIPHDAAINLDLSLTEFIDHTVMEHLSEYEENHIRRGGFFEIIGLDNHATSTNHPLATRVRTSANQLSKPSESLTSRQLKLKDYAINNELTFDPNTIRFPRSLDPFHFFRLKTVDRCYNQLIGTVSGQKVTVKDVDFHSGELQAKVDYHTTLAIIELEKEIPKFTLEKEHLFDQLAALAGYNAIDFQEFKNFSRKFKLTGESESEIREFFNEPLIQFLEKNLSHHIESSGTHLLIIGKERLLSQNEVSLLLDFVSDLLQLAQAK